MNHPEQLLEIHPDPPHPREGLKYRADELITARTALRVDDAAGTLTWMAEKSGAGDVVMALPGREVTGRSRLVRLSCLSVALAPILSRQLIFVAEDGRCLARSTLYYEEQFRRLWPTGRLEQLERFGIEVIEETIRSPRSLQKRYPGANPRWLLQSPGLLATLISSVLLLTAGLALAVYLLSS